MKKSKTIRPLAMNAAEMSKYLMQLTNKWMSSPKVNRMTSFSNEITGNSIYLNEMYAGALDAVHKKEKLYVSAETLKILGYKIQGTRTRLELLGDNRIVIDPLTLKTEINDELIKFDLIQINGKVYINKIVFEELTGTSITEKDTSLWIIAPLKKFTLKTDAGNSVIKTFFVKSGTLYVKLFAVLLALPSFDFKNDTLRDRYSGIVIHLHDFKDNDNYAIIPIIEQAKGTAILNKQDGEYILDIVHESNALLQEDRKKLNFVQNLATIPPIETDNIEEAVLHEINAYRVALGKSSVVSGVGTEIKGRVKMTTLTNIAKTVYTAMFSKENREIVLGEIKSIFIQSQGRELDLLAYES